MASQEIHVGDVGTILERTVTDGGVAVDISTASVRQFILRKPSGAAATKTAAFSTDGSDGKLRYVTVADDLDQAGQWSLQVYLEMTAGKWHSDVAVFDVYPNLS